MDKQYLYNQTKYTYAISGISLFSIFIGFLVLVGYQFDIIAFKSITPFWIGMKANTAICFLLSGIMLWLLRKSNIGGISKIIINIFSFIIIIFSLLTLIEYLLGINFGIDKIFFNEQLHTEDIIHPGRTSLATTMGLLFLGLSFLLINAAYCRDTAFQLPAFIVLTIGFFGFLGYFYNINAVFGFTDFTKMAIHTALTLIVLSIGLLLAKPTVGMMGLLISNTVGGKSLRNLLPYMVVVPLLIGFLENIGEKINLFGPAFGDNIQVTGTIIFLVLVVIIDAKNINKDEKRHDK